METYKSSTSGASPRNKKESCLFKIASPEKFDSFGHKRQRGSVLKWIVLFFFDGVIVLIPNARVVPRPSWITRMTAHRMYIFVLTYVIYVTYHIVRKPLSVVKNVLRQQNCSAGLSAPSNSSSCAWAPFDRNDSMSQFSILDFTYRFSYSIGMFLAGPLVERLDIRVCLLYAMASAGLWMIFCGMAFYWSVHVFSYFVVGQLFSGLFQAIGWPSTLTVMGNWFGKKRRGLIFGIWNTDTSVGNILGTILAGVWVDHEWGLSFIVPGIFITGFGVVAYLFVVVHPKHVELSEPDPEFTNVAHLKTDLSSQELADLSKDQVGKKKSLPKPISVWAAIKVPGVIEYAFCLLFSKAVYYAFFFWLPVYIKDATHSANRYSADISAVFDAGGIIGGILGGFLSDYTKHGRAAVCWIMLVCAIPCIYCMERYVAEGQVALVILLLVIGFFLNGPYTLITTAVSIDIGILASRTHNRNALATIVAVIDFMGALGSALGPLGAGLLSGFGWKGVFYYLMATQVAALLCLTRLVFVELRDKLRAK